MNEEPTPINQQPENKDKEPLAIYQIIMLFLSIYTLTALLVSAVLKLDPQTEKLVDYLDAAICLVFFIDFVQCFIKAPNKWRYMRWGWIDLISCIPVVDALRAGRLIRVIRILRVLRGIRSAKIIMSFVFRSKAKGTLTVASMVALLMVTFCSVAVLHFEQGPDANIKNAEDALWWAMVTVTTVGYGDRFPTTTEGRMLGVFLMATGVGLFGTLTGYVANIFLEKSDDDEEQAQKESDKKIDALLAEVKELRALVESDRNAEEPRS